MIRYILRIFGALILATEFKLEFILKYFKFMEGTIGKGVFLVLYYFVIYI